MSIRNGFIIENDKSNTKNYTNNHSQGITKEVIENNIKPPKYHSKCRYDPSDKNCENNSQYKIENNNNVTRFPVRIKEIPWHFQLDRYNPTNVDVKQENNDNNINNILVNQSYHERFLNDVLKESQHLKGVLNPVGRTGVVGHGALNKFGPNHTVDMFVTRWKRDKKKNIFKNEKTGKKILEFLAIKKEDTNEWTIPGGSLEPNGTIHDALMRIFKEQVLSKYSNFRMKTFQNKIIAVSRVRDFCYVEGLQAHIGYIDDPRNTDNAWVETIVYNFHDDEDDFMRKLTIREQNGNQVAKWVEVNSDVNLYANYAEILQEISQYHNSNW